jgi:hypothetical protein
LDITAMWACELLRAKLRRNWTRACAARLHGRLDGNTLGVMYIASRSSRNVETTATARESASVAAATGCVATGEDASRHRRVDRPWRQATGIPSAIILAGLQRLAAGAVALVLFAQVQDPRVVGLRARLWLRRRPDLRTSDPDQHARSAIGLTR